MDKMSADFFYEQCVGSYSGHMSAIPYTPTLHSFFGGNKRFISKKEFAKFLKLIAEELDKQED